MARMLNSSKTAEDRFFDKVDITGTCWLWTASKNIDGYGHFKVNGVSSFAHRFAYHTFNKPLKFGDVVRHTCDTPWCVNPKHLLVGTHADNVADRVNRNRGAKGIENGTSKLTKEIIEYCRKSNKTYKKLAAQFGVSYSTMRRACVGITWN